MPLEFYDFIIFVFFANVLGGLFFRPRCPTPCASFRPSASSRPATLRAPLGGIVMAHFGDLPRPQAHVHLQYRPDGRFDTRHGPPPDLRSDIHLGPDSSLALRIVQGAAIGGEVPGAWVFVSEHLPPGRVGYACGTLTAGLTSGILLGSLVATVVNHVYTPAEISGWAWRLPFLLGGAFGLMSIYLRLLLSETPVFLEMRARKALAAELPLKAVIRDHRGAVIVSMLLTLDALRHHRARHSDDAGPSPASGRAARSDPLSEHRRHPVLDVRLHYRRLIIDRIGPARFFIFGGALLAISAGFSTPRASPTRRFSCRSTP